MYSKEELIGLSKPYFKDTSIQVMYGVTDGNFFYEHALAFANGHISGKKHLKIFKIVRADLEEQKDFTLEAPKDFILEELSLKELKEFAEANKIKLTKKSKADILDEIELALKTDTNE